MRTKFFIKSFTYHNLITGDVVKKLFVQTVFGSVLIPYSWKKAKRSKKDECKSTLSIL
nr:MAG TPA: hypothetical protein [Caudoviricetes sp.]